MRENIRNEHEWEVCRVRSARATAEGATSHLLRQRRWIIPSGRTAKPPISEGMTERLFHYLAKPSQKRKGRSNQPRDRFIRN